MKNLPIKGYEDLYEIYSDGKIWSNYTHKFLKPIWQNNGYYAVTLCKSKKHKQCLIHKLVLENFVSLRPKGMVCNHKDGKKHNNILKNLEWVTYHDNSVHAWKNGLAKSTEVHKKAASKNGRKRRKFNLYQIREIRSLYATGDYSTHKLGVIYEISQAHIWQIVNFKSYIDVK